LLWSRPRDVHACVRGVSTQPLLLHSLAGKEKKTFCIEGINSRHLVADERQDFGRALSHFLRYLLHRNRPK